MKIVLYLSALFGLMLTNSCVNKGSSGESTGSVMRERSLAKTDSSYLQKAFTVRCGTLQIVPIDESETDTSLLRFVNHLKRIVSQKNTNDLLDLIGPHTITSHGGGVVGKKDFTKHWQLQKDPSSSALWPKLDRALKLGGCFNKKSENREFVMPYLQAAHFFDNGCDFDWFNTYVCLNSSTKIYEKPDKASKVVAGLNYRILKSDCDAIAIGSFIPVYTIDQTVQGYVEEHNVYLCSDYMLVISERSGEWNIDAFSPFD